MCGALLFMAAGRPATYNSVEEIQSKIEAYFKFIEGEWLEDNKANSMIRPPEPATITGLALFLGFESRQSFYDYENKDEFAYTIKRARTMIESEYEKKLGSHSCTGAIFALKNMGWKDKIETEHSGGLDITWNEQKTYEVK